MISVTDVNEALQALALARPIFHSEADFQHALAWELQRRFPDAQIRLELPVQASDKWMQVDIWITHEGAALALELKYLKRSFPAPYEHENEVFNLKNHGAQDLGRYDFAKDIWRLEQLASSAPQVSGCAILLTNDEAYWKTPKSDAPPTIDAAFRLHHGRRVFGSLAWSTNAGGTIKNREDVLNLAREYELSWQDYSVIGAPKNNRFRYLLIPVEPR